MHFLAFATDYDGTLASKGSVNPKTLDALRRLRESGRKLILVTGRLLPELKKVFPEYRIFDRIVAENGALLYDPVLEREFPLAPKADERLIGELKMRNVVPLSHGYSIIATVEPHGTDVLNTIRSLQLDLDIILNREAVMILPKGISKDSGVRAALEALGVSRENTIAVGDAENDQALLAHAALGVAVENALPSLKDQASYVTKAREGEGVVELIDQLLADETGLSAHHQRRPSS